MLTLYGFDDILLDLKVYDFDIDNPTGTYLLVEIKTSEADRQKYLEKDS